MEMHTLYGKLVPVYSAQEALPLIQQSIDDNIVQVGTRKKSYIVNTVNTFDIETTKLKNINSEKDEGKYSHFNYSFVQQACFNGVFVLTRYADDYFNLLDSISAYLKSLDAKMIIYVHKLAYEFNNLSEYFYRGYTDNPRDILMRSATTPIFVRYRGNIEFRCSYLLTHKPLSKISKEVGLEKPGDYDYTKPRHSKTPLTEEEIEYSLRDVYNLYVWLREEVKNYSASIDSKPLVSNLPYTQTGYVRRELKKHFSNTKEGNTLLKRTALDEAEFELMHKAFWGGDTHANPKHVGEIVTNVKHRDFTSAYPSALVLEKYPITKFWHSSGGIKDVKRFISAGYAVVATYALKNVKLKPHCTGYIPVSKCDAYPKSAKIENGRIVEASGLILTICEVDFATINQVYDFEISSVYNIMYAKKAPLPKAFVDVILNFFVKKSTLKGVEDKAFEYSLSKQMLNAIFGCSAQSLEVIKYLIEDDYDIYTGATEYQKARVLPYQWSVYTTAYVRQKLNYFKAKLGDNFIYGDTDSLFYIPTEESEKMFNQYQERVINHINNVATYYGYTIDEIAPKYNGKRQYLFNFAEEVHVDENGNGHTSIDRFITVGAKRYITQSGERVDVTMSGLRNSKWDKDKKCKGSNIRKLEHDYQADIFDIFKRIGEGESFTLKYVEKQGTMLNYNERGTFDGFINDGITTEKVTAHSSMVLVPTDQHFSIEPTLYSYITSIMGLISLDAVYETNI